MTPHLTPPPDWSGWWAHYDDGLRQPFVRDWRIETRQNIEAAFAAGSFPHAAAVSALQRVPLRLDQSLVPLVEEFAIELMGHQVNAPTTNARSPPIFRTWDGWGNKYFI